jgi:FkbM family methyltransferase
MIKFLMTKYRGSRFHNAENGRRLAKILYWLTRFTSSSKKIKKIGAVTFELDLREIIDASLYFASTFEQDVENLFKKYVHENNTVIDVGANIGYHTLHSAEYVGGGGKVVAIEPNQWAINRLTRNLELNPQIQERVHIIKVALSDRDELSQEMSFQASYKLSGKNAAVSEIVDVRSLDSICDENGLSGISLIKIDVDGFEIKVLNGSLDLLARDHPTLIVEFTPSVFRQLGDEIQAVEQALRSIGYSFFTVSEDPIRDLTNHLNQLHDGDSEMVLLRVM